MKSILVLDFGGQYAHLIANRIRNLGSYSEIVSNDISVNEIDKKKVSGIIFSGGPSSIFEKNSPKIDNNIFLLGIPILGICYGHQLISNYFGGEIKTSKLQEFGKSYINFSKDSEITKNMKSNSVMWMNHGDEVIKLPKGFDIIISTKNCEIAGMENKEQKIYSVQFHPEVSHSEEGDILLKNFISICGLDNSWSIDNFIDNKINEINKKCNGKKVFLLVSGGVDSTVCLALLSKALGEKNVFGCLIDHGMMRQNESNEVEKMLTNTGFNSLHIENAESLFLNDLKNTFDPECKRISIGNNFIKIQELVSNKLGLNPSDWILSQGTIYPDTIESGSTKNSSKIKTHHNRVAKIQKMIDENKIIEPISDLYKDEVRTLGYKLGLPKELIERHPFPGPGLGVRILCAEKGSILDNYKNIEKILSNNYENINLKVLPIKSVGVQGDSRSYKHPISIFDNENISRNYFNWDFYKKIAVDIPNKYPEINRVLLNIYSSKDEYNYIVRKSEITKDRIKILQNCDKIVRDIIFDNKKCDNIWQFPVILAPLFLDGGESIILRPISSENAMTADVVELPNNIINEIVYKINNFVPEIKSIFYDLTSKPPGTIEWE
jgi:GMP synthase (glutamine-hydrolysing)